MRRKLPEANASAKFWRARSREQLHAYLAALGCFTMVLVARRAPRPLSHRATFVARTSLGTRFQSSQATSDTTPATAQLSSRWLSDVKQRIGKCITFGLTPSQTTAAGAILKQLSRDWRELVAGSEGFLTSPERRGLHRSPIAWGDQDSMVRSTLALPIPRRTCLMKKGIVGLRQSPV